MGRWGEGLFESDDDLDQLGFISDNAGLQLYHYGLDPEDAKFKFGGKGMEATREHLDSGVFKRLFNQYDKEGYGDDELITPKIVLLAACAMRVGATLSRQQMKVLDRLCKDFEFCGYDQIQRALKHYKNDGTPYEFVSESLYEIAAVKPGAPPIKRCHGPGCAKYEHQLAGNQKLQVCGRCKEVYYCGKECQESDWSAHKLVCKAPAATT